MPKPLSYITRADQRAEVATLQAAFFAAGGEVRRFDGCGRRVA